MAYKPQEIKINNFGGGIADNPRKNSASDFIISKHFDIFTDTQKLTPYRSLEEDVSTGDEVNVVESPETTVNDTTIGSVAWDTPNNSQSSNNTYTTVALNSVIDSYSEANASANFILANDGTGRVNAVGQSFYNATETTIDNVVFSIKKGGSPTGNAVVKIYNHTGTYGTTSKPTGIALATSDNFDVSSLTTSAALTTFSFSGANRITLNATSYYVAVVEYTGGETSNVVYVENDSTSPTHGGNSVATINFTTWTAYSNADVIFYVNGALTSNYLKATNFGFAIPAGSAINGIKVEIEQKATTTCTENEVKIVKASGEIGTLNRATGATIPSTDTYVAYGSATDLWDLSWSIDDINDTDFGVVFSAKGSGTVSVDHVRIIVYYRPSVKENSVKDFIYASTSAKLYGLGQTGAGLTKILQKADATTGLWTKPANSEGNGAVWNGSLTEFKDYLWGFQGTNQIWKWGLLSGTPSITNSIGTTASTITSVANGVINSLGDLYIAYNNVIVRIAPDTTTVTDSAKTVPSNYKITSMCNFGNYLAIGCAPISPYNGISKVFLWDYASTEKFQEAIDWGEGEIRVLETIEGLLVGVSDRYLNNSAGAGKGSMVIQGYTGGTVQVLKEVFTQKLTGKTMPTAKAIKNNRLFFAAKIMTNTAGTTYDEGVWSFGRKSAAYPWALTLDIIDENVDTNGIQGFGTAGNYFFIAHSNDGSIDKTNDESVYTFTSIYESLIFDFGDANLDKQLQKIIVTTPPLPTSSTITVKIKVNADTSWTTVGTITTANKMSREFINIESTGGDFPTFKELKVRLESTGGAEITSMRLQVLPLTGAENG